MGPYEANLTMSQARVEANVVAKGAAGIVSHKLNNVTLYMEIRLTYQIQK